MTYSFQDLTLQDFVKSCIEDDLADHNLYAKVFNEGYLARVTDAHSYLAVTRDVLNRFGTTFPDSFFPCCDPFCSNCYPLNSITNQSCNEVSYWHWPFKNFD